MKINSPQSVLLIGLSNSGKSHFGAQFEIRLALGRAKLRRTIIETDTSLFGDVKSNLYEGLASKHTPTGTKKDKNLSLIYDERLSFDLVWQDYAGEQIADVFESRRIGHSWVKDVENSNSWILFIRVEDLKVKKDLISQIPNRFKLESSSGAHDETHFEFSDQTRFIELLQQLLYVRRAPKNPRITFPRLTVALTCWDEILPKPKNSANPEKPLSILEKKAPMLAEYLSQTWADERWSVIGLSSLGQALSTTDPDEEFAKSGPDKAGFTILADGTISDDLTLPVVDSLKDYL